MRWTAVISRKICLFVLPLAGLALILLVNHPAGLGVAYDSVFYISMAKHIAAGKGVYVYMGDIATASGPMTHYCPFYPFVLSLFFLCGFGIKSSVWILAGILFAANIYLASWIIFRYTQSLAAGFLTGLVFILDPLWQSMHSWILTEPLFIFTVNLSLFFLCRYLETGKKRDFVSSVVFCGIATLTRYTGISYAASGALCLLLLSETPFFQRLKNAFLYGFFSSIPLFAWLLRNIVRTYRPHASLSQLAFGDLGDAKFGLSRSFMSYSLDACRKTLSWLSHHAVFEIKLNSAFILALFILGLALAAWSYKKNLVFLSKNPVAKLPYILIVYGTSYMFFLISFLLYSGQRINIDQRYMMIFYMYLVFLLMLWVHREIKNFRRQAAHKFFRVCFYSVCILTFGLWFGVTLNRTRLWAEDVMKRGIDNTHGVSWKFVQTRHWFPPHPA